MCFQHFSTIEHVFEKLSIRHGLPFRNMKVYMSKRDALDAMDFVRKKSPSFHFFFFLAHSKVIVEHG